MIRNWAGFGNRFLTDGDLGIWKGLILGFYGPDMNWECLGRVGLRSKYMYKKWALIKKKLDFDVEGGQVITLGQL